VCMSLTETASHYVMRAFVMLLIKGNLLTLPLFTKQYKLVLARDADTLELERRAENSGGLSPAGCLPSKVEIRDAFRTFLLRAASFG